VALCGCGPRAQATYVDMIIHGVAALNDRNGSSLVAVRKWIKQNYPETARRQKVRCVPSKRVGFPCVVVYHHPATSLQMRVSARRLPSFGYNLTRPSLWPVRP
jgi:hypothetical protein